MKSSEVTAHADELEDIMIETAGLDPDITAELSDEYAIHVWALKHINHSYPFEQALRVQEICDQIEGRLPRVSNRVFDQYTVYMGLLAILLQEVPRKEEL